MNNSEKFLLSLESLENDKFNVITVKAFPLKTIANIAVLRDKSGFYIKENGTWVQLKIHDVLGYLARSYNFLECTFSHASITIYNSQSDFLKHQMMNELVL